MDCIFILYTNEFYFPIVYQRIVVPIIDKWIVFSYCLQLYSISYCLPMDSSPIIDKWIVFSYCIQMHFIFLLSTNG